MKTPGQVAFEGAGKINWKAQPASVKDYWERIAQAVISFYETGKQGER